jgi:hypothetical protein
MFGVVTINGKQFMERPQYFPQDIAISSNGQVLLAQRLVLPGVAPFRLKQLNRTVVKSNAVVTNGTCPFKFKFGTTEGGVWFCQAGAGGTNDRVVDTNIFGTAQFPGVVVPPIYYDATSSITFEIEDISNNSPYTISLGWVGCYLIPVQ